MSPFFRRLVLASILEKQRKSDGLVFFGVFSRLPNPPQLPVLLPLPPAPRPIPPHPPRPRSFRRLQLGRRRRSRTRNSFPDSGCRHEAHVFDWSGRGAERGLEEEEEGSARGGVEVVEVVATGGGGASSRGLDEFEEERNKSASLLSSIRCRNSNLLTS